MSCRTLRFRSRLRTRELLALCGLMAGLALPGCGVDIVDEGSDRDKPAPNVLLTVQFGANQVVKAGAQFPEAIQVRATVNGQPFNDHLNFDYTDPNTPTPVSALVLKANANGQYVFTRKVGLTPGPFTVTVYHHHCARGNMFWDCSKLVKVGTVVVNGQIVAP